MRIARLLLILLFAPWAAAASFTWTGAAGDGVYGNPANWAGATVPPNNGTAVLVFGNAGAGSIRLAATLNVSQVRFENAGGASYTFSAPSSGTLLTVHDGIVSTSTSARNRFDSSVRLNLVSAQAFDLAGGRLEIDGTILGTGALTKTGAGNLKLGALNLWTGGLNHSAGTLTLGRLVSLGLGTLRLSGGALDFGASEHALIPNAVVIEANTTISGTPDHYAAFAGPVTLQASVTLTASTTSGVFITGPVRESGGSHQLTVRGMAPVILAGASQYTGGTRIEGGRLVFSTREAVPPSGSIKASALGYVGIAFNDSVQSALIDRLSPGEFLGIIGFDTAPWATGPARFTGNVDLSELSHYAGVGSQSSAVVEGMIKVGQGDDYRFGGGGGTLYLESNLTARGENLQVVSPFGQPLTLVLRGTNTFKGAANVQYSLLILDQLHAVGKSTPLNLTGPGYIGVTERAQLSPGDFLGRIGNIASADSIVGFDSHSLSSPRTISAPIDLSVGGTRTDPYYLGTGTRVTLTGNLTPTVGDALYLTALKGGHLTVRSQLGENIPGLVVGQTNAFDSQGGTVEILGNNTFSGGTQVRGGQLRMGSSQALGTGGVSVADRATLEVASGATLTNALSLAPGARLSGDGRISPPGGLTLSAGAILSPGGVNEVGRMTFGSGLSLGTGGVFEFDIASLLGVTPGWDTIDVAGTLSIVADISAPFTIEIHSLTPGGEAGLLSGFDPTVSYSWEFATATSLVGLTPSAFTFDTTDFLNGTGNGAFFVSQSGNSLMINFTPVPEPSTYVLFALGAAIVGFVEWRRRKQR